MFPHPLWAELDSAWLKLQQTPDQTEQFSQRDASHLQLFATGTKSFPLLVLHQHCEKTSTQSRKAPGVVRVFIRAVCGGDDKVNRCFQRWLLLDARLIWPENRQISAVFEISSMLFIIYLCHLRCSANIISFSASTWATCRSHFSSFWGSHGSLSPRVQQVSRPQSGQKPAPSACPIFMQMFR